MNETFPLACTSFDDTSYHRCHGTADIVFRHKRVAIERLDSIFPITYRLLITLVDYIVAVQPHDIILGCLAETEISCGSKIIYPFEVIHLVGELGCNFFCIVGRTRINNYNLVGKRLYTVKTPSDYLRLT